MSIGYLFAVLLGVIVCLAVGYAVFSLVKRLD